MLFLSTSDYFELTLMVIEYHVWMERLKPIDYLRCSAIGRDFA